jgi:gliding motility-associated-like protein
MSNDPANSCGAVNDTLLLTISLPPNVDAGTMQSLACGAATTVLTGSSTALSPSFNWSGPGIVSGGSTASATVNATGLYTLTVTSGNCSNTDTVSVISNINAPNVDAGAADTLTCITLIGSLTGTSTTAGAQFSWSGPSIVSGGSTATPTVNAAGVYTLTVTDPANNCTATDTVVVENITTPPNANAGSGQTITCSATSVVLNGSSTTAGTSFSWSGLGIVSGGSTATPTVNAAGTYTVTVTDGVNGCSATSTVVVASNTIPPTADAGPPQPIGCGIIAAILDGSASSTGISITYTWTTTNGNIVAGTNSITPTVDAAGSYTVTVTNTATGCSSVDSVLVVAAPAPSASFSSNPMSGTSPLPVDFTNTSTLSNTYVWNFGDGSALVSTANPSYVYTSPGTYTVTLIASNNNGCPDTATSTIIVFDDFTVVIPNIFTPNGDNNNDQFKVSSTGVESLKGEIYDRWGLKLYDWNQINEGWDGRTQSGVVVVDGTYYYIITLKAQDGKEHLYKGFIQLLSK